MFCWNWGGLAFKLHVTTTIVMTLKLDVMHVNYFLDKEFQERMYVPRYKNVL